LVSTNLTTFGLTVLAANWFWPEPAEVLYEQAFADGYEAGAKNVPVHYLPGRLRAEILYPTRADRVRWSAYGGEGSHERVG